MPGKNNTCSYLSGYKHNTITKANSSEDRTIIRHSRHPEPTTLARLAKDLRMARNASIH